MKSSVDVLVVGGGPAGLAVAERVAAGGGSVIVVHRDRRIGLPVRTSGGSWKKHLESLGVPASLYHEIRQLDFAAPGRVVSTSFGEDCPVILDVTAAFRHLAALAERAGAQIYCGTTFERITDQNGQFVCCVVNGNGRECQVTARFVIDASGHHRAVLTEIGVAQRPARFGVGVEYEFRNAGTDPRRAVLFVGSEFAPSGYGWIFPTAAGMVRVGIGLLRPDTRSSPADLLDAFLRSSAANDFELKVGELVAKYFGIIPSDGVASRFVHGGVISVGDSAGQALPLVGEGIRYSIEAGRRAGDAIAFAVRNPNEAAASLQRYEQWWRGTYARHFGLAQKANVRMSAFAETDWQQVGGLLSGLSGDEVASLFRMDFSKRFALKIAWKWGSGRLLRNYRE